MLKDFLKQISSVMLIVVFSTIVAFAQQGKATLRGVVADEFGGAIVGASVTLTDASGQKRTAVTNAEGVYSFDGLGAGRYSLRAFAKGFAETTEADVEIKVGERRSLDLLLKVTIEEQKVTVGAETAVNTEAANNANQTLITGKDLDALPDDPDELAAALQALAGPSVGPEGGQIFVDGFSGGRLPSKDSIREIRINQNPFAPENDQPSGRIDILTKPGTDKFRGSSFFNFNDEVLNSRNPFSSTRPPFQVRQFGGNLSGPVVKGKASFFLDFDGRELDDNELVTARVLDANLNPVSIGQAVQAPRRFTSVSPRFDYAINPRNTLVARYSYFHSAFENNGVVGFSLPERAYDSLSNSQTVQLTETAVLNPTTINEVKFQYAYSQSENLGALSPVAINVTGSFISGGSQVGHALNTDKRWEVQDFVSRQQGQHALKFGGRLRHVHVDSSSPANFGGTYAFTGGGAPQIDANGDPIPNTAPIVVDSLERYRRTLLLQPRTLLSPGDPQFLTVSDIRARGGGAAQFNISSGDPQASVSQFDFALYAQDDWRVRPNLTLSYGLRYEHQTNIDSPLNFAPRVAVAWSPGAANSARPPKMVLRFGGGMFYNRFGENQTLQANRYNGVNTQQFTLKENARYDSNQNPLPVLPTALDAFSCPTSPCLPPLSGEFSSRLIQWRVAPDLHAPTVYVGAAQMERQLPYKISMFAGVFILQIQHVIRSRDLNAPIPGSITSTNPFGVRPMGNIGDVYQYESSGTLNQQRFFVGFNSRLNPRISLFSNYSLSYSRNNTDGQGSSSFSANPYDMHGEYGRSSFDIRQRLFLGGSVNLPWWHLTLNPLIFASSGAPFNMITGADTNLDGQFTERPSFAPAGVACSGPSKPVNIICTPFGNFNLQPALGEALIPRNYGSSPAYVSINLGISKTFAFGTIHSGKSAANSTQKTAAAPMASGPSAGAKGTAGSSGGTQGRPAASSGIGLGGGAGGSSKEAKRYSLQLSVNAANLFNHANLRPLEGNLSSPFFGESLGLSPFGGGGGDLGSVGAGNRRITFRARFNF
jgi:hypothetical protein